MSHYAPLRGRVGGGLASDRLVLLALSVCAVLLLFRFGYYHPRDPSVFLDLERLRGNNTLLFFGWNLILAALPYVLLRFGEIVGRAGWFFVGLALLFLPNAPYLVSDLIHLRARPPVPFVYDLMLFTLCVGTGLLLGALAVVRAARGLRWRVWSPVLRIMSLALFPLCGFGIYLGRVLRWNSWDAVFRPHLLLADFGVVFNNPFAREEAILYSLCYGLLFALVTGLVAGRGKPCYFASQDE